MENIYRSEVQMIQWKNIHLERQPHFNERPQRKLLFLLARTYKQWGKRCWKLFENSQDAEFKAEK